MLQQLLQVHRFGRRYQIDCLAPVSDSVTESQQILQRATAAASSTWQALKSEALTNKAWEAPALYAVTDPKRSRVASPRIQNRAVPGGRPKSGNVREGGHLNVEVERLAVACFLPSRRHCNSKPDSSPWVEATQQANTSITERDSKGSKAGKGTRNARESEAAWAYGAHSDGGGLQPWYWVDVGSTVAARRTKREYKGDNFDRVASGALVFGDEAAANRDDAGSNATGRPKTWPPPQRASGRGPGRRQRTAAAKHVVATPWPLAVPVSAGRLRWARGGTVTATRPESCRTRKPPQHPLPKAVARPAVRPVWCPPAAARERHGPTADEGEWSARRARGPETCALETAARGGSFGSGPGTQRGARRRLSRRVQGVDSKAVERQGRWF
ncbi:hypothetical protein K505DRAFT_421511 [Melanomma pulvis-pyrius CBS 109.77]|uniref:Uncharacterized protein n=1 Tax=Melanomma pulvis-pyrius CBS 109.77 TaxID=1314802 RepID=A0A6A6WVF5_9PLEO|nr:hypothetical protein K505DRAFT_421511 [Melanomma pulvis-pyrius CBS 109.77]